MKKIYSLFFALLAMVSTRTLAQVSAYTFAESTETYAAVGGTNITATGDDGSQNGLPIGFTFKYGGSDYTTFSANTNGWIRLGANMPTSSTWDNTIFGGSATTHKPLIAAFWDDNHRNTGAISYALTGTAPNQVLEVGWNNVNIGGGGSTSATNFASFKLRLYETTNVVEFVYGGTMAAAGTLTASIGLNDNTSFLSVTPAATSTVSSATANNAISATTNVVGKKYTFTPPFVSSELMDYVNLQFPGTATVPFGTNVTIYTQGYEPGVTEAPGAGAGVQAWIGYSTTNSNPNTWSNWIPATFNVQVGNNDEFMIDLGSTLPAGTYYYASRWKLGSGAYSYGGFNAGGGDGFWDGTNDISGVLTVSPPPPPANDNCATATVISSFPYNFNQTDGAYATQTAFVTSCSAAGPGSMNDGVWYKITGTGCNVTVVVTPTGWDPQVDVYSGSCGTFTCVTAKDDGGSGGAETVTFLAVAGTDYFINIGYYSGTTDGAEGPFTIAATQSCCTAVNTPYTQNFNGVTPPAIPTCMAVENTNGDTRTWRTLTGITNFPEVSSNAIGYQYNTDGTTAANDWLFTPGINLTSGTSYTIKFKYLCTSAPDYTEKLRVVRGAAASSASMASGVVLFDDNNVDNVTYSPQAITFTVPSTGVYYFGFYAYSDADQDWLILDDIEIDVTPPCPIPSVTVGNRTENSATATWPETGTFILEYGATGFTPGTGATAGTGGTLIDPATSPQVIGGLSPATTYQVYVRQNCTGSGNGYSTNSSVVTFTTAPGCTNNTAPANGATDVPYAGGTTISWTPVTGATGYEVLFSDDNGATYTSLGVTTNTTEVVTGLDPLTTYFYYVIPIANGTPSVGCEANATSFTTAAVPAPPANDECGGAVGISGTPTAGTTVSATNSLPWGSCDTSDQDPNDVWYQFTATANGNAIVTVSNLTFDAVVEAFSGACGSLTSIGCEDGTVALPEVLELTGLVAGQTYFIRVSGYDAEEGNFSIAVTGAALPVSIEYFRGTKQNNRNILDWKISCYNSPSVRLTLERSVDGRKFDAISTTTETAVRCLQPFNYNDQSPAAGINYYRLKAMDIDGKVSYSNVVALLNKDKGFEIVSLAPNPVKDEAILSVTSAEKTIMEIVVSDLNGKQISKQRLSLIAGNNQVPLNLRNVAAGTYQVTGLTADGQLKSLRFIKQ